METLKLANTDVAGFLGPELVEELRYLAWDKCTTPARIALAWLQPRGDSGDITLSDQEIRRLDAIAPAAALNR